MNKTANKRLFVKLKLNKISNSCLTRFAGLMGKKTLKPYKKLQRNATKPATFPKILKKNIPKILKTTRTHTMTLQLDFVSLLTQSNQAVRANNIQKITMATFQR